MYYLCLLLEPVPEPAPELDADLDSDPVSGLELELLFAGLCVFRSDFTGELVLRDGIDLWATIPMLKTLTSFSTV